VAEFVQESVITVAAPGFERSVEGDGIIANRDEGASPGEPSSLLPMVEGSRPEKDAYVPPCMLG
jgi:hypothetical protein